MNSTKKILAIFLSLLMLFTALPIAAGAANETKIAETAPEADATAEKAEIKDPLGLFSIDIPDFGKEIGSARAKARRKAPAEENSVSFSWDEETKTLSFSGNGPMPDYSFNEAEGGSFLPETPWSDYSDTAKKVVIGDSITSVGAFNFAAFEALEEVVLPETVSKIGFGAFYFCPSLSSINLPDGLTEIGESAFVGNSLSSISIPGGVTELNGLFLYNSVPLNITFAEGIRSIKGCFDRTVIPSLTIPSTGQEFTCGSIINTQTLVNNSATAVVSDSLCSASELVLELASFETKFEIKYQLAYLKAGNELTQEDMYDLYLELYNGILGTSYTDFTLMMNDMQSGNLPEEAQAKLESLQESGDMISAPLSTISIFCLSESAEHDALRANGYPHYLIDLDGALCTEPVVLKCGDNLSWSIEEGTLVISGYGEMYDEYKGFLFHRDEIQSIRFVEDGGPITHIGSYAFRSFGAIASLVLPAGVDSFGYYWIDGCQIGSFFIPAGFSHDIDLYNNNGFVFGSDYNTTIDSFSVEDGNGKYFSYDGALYKITGSQTNLVRFGKSSDEIYPQTDRILYYSVINNDISSVTIPASVSVIEYSAFYDCGNLSTVTIEPGSSLDLALSSFNSCGSLSDFIVSENDTRFKAVDGVLFSKDMTKVIAVPYRTNELVLPASVTSISSQNGINGSAYSYDSANLLGLKKLTINNPYFSFGNYDLRNSNCAFLMADHGGNYSPSEVEIVGYSKSTAEEFAMQKGYVFTSLDGVTIESVVFDLSNVPSTVSIGDQPSLSDWHITGVATYSDGTTKNVSVNRIYYKSPGYNNWSESNWFSAERSGDYEFEIRFGPFVTSFTISVPDINYHYEFDTTDAVTEIKQYSSSSEYQVSRNVQTGENSWTTFYDSILGVKLYKVYDDGETERELMNIGNNVQINYSDDQKWWGELVNEDPGTYTVSFSYNNYYSSPISTSIEIEVVPGDFTIELDFSAVPSTVIQFGELTNENWGARAKIIMENGEEYDVSDKLSFSSNMPGQDYNTISGYVYTAEPGERNISPFLSIYNYYGDTFVSVNKAYPSFTATVVPDETVESVRLEVLQDVIEADKNVPIDLSAYVEAYITRNGVEEQFTDKSGFIFEGTTNGGRYNGKYCNLSYYGETVDYTVSFSSESAAFRVVCVQKLFFDIQAEKTEFRSWPDTFVGINDFGLTVTMTDIDTGATDTADYMFFNEGDALISTPGSFTKTLQAHFPSLGTTLPVGTVNYTVVQGPTFELKGIPGELTLTQGESFSLENAVVEISGDDEARITSRYFTFLNESGIEVGYNTVNTSNPGTYFLKAYAYGIPSDFSGIRYIDNQYIQNDIVTVNVLCAHNNTVFVPAVPGSDCEHAGTAAYYECPTCHEKFADENATEAINDLTGDFGAHDLSFVPEEGGSDCEHTGTIAYYECSLCKNKFADENGEEAVSDISDGAYGPHSLTRTPEKAATCKAEGNIEYWSCSVCGDRFSDANGENAVSNITIPKAAHTLVKTEAKAETCTEEGNVEFWTCSVCEKIFGDAEGNREITAAQTVITAKGHIFVEVSRDPATCMQEGTIHCVCVNDESHTKTEPIPKVGHKDDDGDGFCDFGCGTEIRNPNACKWCGKDHSSGNFWQKIVGFFHRIFAAIFGAKY